MKKFILLSVLSLLCFNVRAQENNENDEYGRVVLLEEFTTEYCMGCPGVTAFLTEVLADKEYQNKVIAVTHHSGFKTDWLTTEADKEYLWFYNTDATFTPGMMYDRYPYFNAGGGLKTPVGSVMKTQTLRKFIDKRLKETSHVTFDIDGTYDGNSQLTLNITGKRNAVFSETDSYITVYLVENNVQSVNQAGAEPDYKHQHVLRDYSSIWGDKIMWNGDTFNHQCTLKVDKSWKQEDMQIIAFVHSMDKNDCNACMVENTRYIPFTNTLGINDITNDDNAVSEEYFTTDGVRTTASGKGLYIVRKTFRDGRQEVKKIIR